MGNSLRELFNLSSWVSVPYSPLWMMAISVSTLSVLLHRGRKEGKVVTGRMCVVMIRQLYWNLKNCRYVRLKEILPMKLLILCLYHSPGCFQNLPTEQFIDIAVKFIYNYFHYFRLKGKHFCTFGLYTEKSKYLQWVWNNILTDREQSNSSVNQSKYLRGLKKL